MEKVLLAPKDVSELARRVAIAQKQVEETLRLLDAGATVPFIARYRKEVTGGLEDIAIENIRVEYKKLQDLIHRKKVVEETIREQGKWTSELEQKISQAATFTEVEDLYLPFKPKRKTRASIARELGLEPLAQWIYKEGRGEAFDEARRWVKGEVKDEEHALQGARDIVAEYINEHESARKLMRQEFQRYAVFSSKVIKGKEQEGAKYADYFAFSEPMSKCPSHRVLALFRGEAEGLLRLSLEPNTMGAVDQLIRFFCRYQSSASDQFEMAITDAYKRLLAPSMENEFRQELKQKADKQAIRVFADNLKQLLLAPPLGSIRMLAIDPGFRTGCKVVCLNEEGKLLDHTVIYPHEPQSNVTAATQTVKDLVKKHAIACIAIGNGTAGRETEDFVRRISFDTSVEVHMVNESGASIYSASEVAREEFPNHDITVRGAVSIGRRLADPLAELVKIDPKSIGVGQYQHDVDQGLLKDSLDAVVLQAVNSVGVNVNTASKSLLTYVSGLGPALAQQIVNYRDENGPFASRLALKKVPRLGEKAFEQCAGFLRIPNGKNGLDNTAVHPERYAVVQQIADDVDLKIPQLLASKEWMDTVNTSNYVHGEVGHFTLQDILKELEKPGRDPRGEREVVVFSAAKKPEDLALGSSLKGVVTNITAFGCFVDIGVKQDGLVHISEMASVFVKDPHEIVKLGQAVNVRVVEVDLARKRIALSMKDAEA